MAIRQYATKMLMNAASRPMHCCVLLEQLRKDWFFLQQEAMHVFPLEEEYIHKLTIFVRATQAVYVMLKSMWTLAEKLHGCDVRIEMLEFVSRMTAAWCGSDDGIAHELANVHLFSRSTIDLPLLLLLDKVQRNTNNIMETFKSISGHFNCFSQSVQLHNKIVPLTARLSHADLTFRYSLMLDKTIPFVKDLQVKTRSFLENLTALHAHSDAHTDDDYHMLRKFIESDAVTGGHRRRYGDVPDLSVFRLVTELLTGQLLGLDKPQDIDFPDAIRWKKIKTEFPGIVPLTAPTIPNLTVEISQHQCSPEELFRLVNGAQGTEDDGAEQTAAVTLWNHGTCYDNSQECLRNAASYSYQDVLYNPVGVPEQGQTVALVWPQHAFRDRESCMKTHLEDYSSLQEQPRARRTATVAAKRKVVPPRNRLPADETDDLQPIKLPRLQQNLFRPLI